MSRPKFVVPYLACTITPFILLTLTLFLFSKTSWDVDGRPFAQWPLPALIQTFSAAFVSFILSLGLFLKNVQISARQAKFAKEPAMPFLTVVGILTLFTGFAAYSWCVVLSLLIHLVAIALGLRHVPDAGAPSRGA